jgi:hypothetical protein
MSQFSAVLENEQVLDFLEGIENKILERGLLTDAVGRGDFVISLGLGSEVIDDEETLKVIVDFGEEDDPINLTADQCDEIQDIILDYLNENGFDEVLRDAGVPQGSEDVNWVHVSVNGNFLYD